MDLKKKKTRANMDFMAMMRERLSVMQATQTDVTFETRHRHPCSDESALAALAALSPDAVAADAETRFPDLWQRAHDCAVSPYRLANLRTDLLTRRVLSELKTAPDPDGTVVLTNGCCTVPRCPTTVFYRAVVEAVAAALED